MAGSMEQMTMSDGAEIGVYHVQPEGERRGGLVLVQEIFGVTEHIRDLAEEYAADGYEVLAPALFDREHPGFEADYSGDGLARGVELARVLHPIDLSLSDVQTCVNALREKGPVFVVGYCYGGSIAWFAATRLEGVAAASSYYGSQVPAAAGEVPSCLASDSLESVLERMRELNLPLMPVVEDDRLLGLVTPENTVEFMLIRRALERK